MLRTTLAAVAVVCTAGLIGAPVATAAPKFCDGAAYKTACTSGPGGAGPIVRYWDKTPGTDWSEHKGGYKFDRKGNVAGKTRDKDGKSVIH
jgi:hypothetical protein